MNHSFKLLLACVPVVWLSACGGGDLQDRLDVADPAVRFVNASATAPNLTLYRSAVAQSDATNVTYKFASDYFDVDTSMADWSVKAAASGSTIGTVSIDPTRGSKYTIVALPLSATETGVYVIGDPYNKPLGSNSTRLRVMNASFNASNIDLYMNAFGTDIAAAGVNPIIAATAYRTSGPASGSDSADIPAGTYQLTITSATTKTVLFKGQLGFGDNKDILVVVVPDPAVPGASQALFKVEGTAGLIQVPAI
jgi:hypothetical protein